jgi:putative sigma-54 modulation protein
MQANIKATNIEITPAIQSYVDKKVESFDRFIKEADESVLCAVEVGKTTKHHMKGDVFKAEVRLHIAGKDLYAVAEKDDLYAAIDEVKDEIIHQLTAHKDKSTTLMRKGALRFKNVVKGLGDWTNKWRG